MCLSREYLALFDDDDARLVAANSSEACTYLWNLHTTGELQLDFRPLNATLLYHTPCHLRALEVGTPGMNLLRLIPGLSVQRIERGCSGMAGTFGLKRDNYRTSLRAGWGLISSLRDSHAQAGDHRVQLLQDPDGARHQQAHGPSAQAAGPGLWSACPRAVHP